jgi:hypothetical protein
MASVWKAGQVARRMRDWRFISGRQISGKARQGSQECGAGGAQPPKLSGWTYGLLPAHITTSPGQGRTHSSSLTPVEHDLAVCLAKSFRKRSAGAT